LPSALANQLKFFLHEIEVGVTYMYTEKDFSSYQLNFLLVVGECTLSTYPPYLAKTRFLIFGLVSKHVMFSRM